MKFIAFIFLAFIFYLSACGLYGNDLGAVFSSNSNTGDVGDGEIPRLSSRSKSRPDLDDEPCEDSAACRLVCKTMYKDLDSVRECEELSYGMVEDIEEVYLALISGENGGDADPNLEDIDSSDLKRYLNIGWDGWIEVVIPKLKDKGKIFTVLKWIGSNSSAADVLRSVKQDTEYDGANAILKELFLNLSSDNSKITFTTISTTAKILIQLKSNSLKCGDNKIIASIASDKKDLFIALSSTYPGNPDDPTDPDYKEVNANTRNFFHYVVDNNAREDAFILAHQLLEEACETQAGTNSRGFKQCIRGFYCWLNAGSNPDVEPTDVKEVNSGLTIGNTTPTGSPTNECDCGGFNAI